MNMIVAVNEDWGIGCNGHQTVVIPEDREYFREVTDGGIVVAGRITFESYGKPLPNRKNIVLTHNKNYKVRGAAVVHSVTQVFEKIPPNCGHKVFVIGGAEVYKQFLPWCSYVYVTKTTITTESDRFFPNLDRLPDWDKVHTGDMMNYNGILFTFELYRSAALG